jgi:hypothetical protein
MTTLDEALDAIRKQTKDRKKLMDTLPKREWVGLTDDEWQALYVHHHDTSGHTDTQWGYEFAIQAKLKEKNT